MLGLPRRRAGREGMGSVLPALRGRPGWDGVPGGEGRRVGGVLEVRPGPVLRAGPGAGVRPPGLGAGGSWPPRGLPPSGWGRSGWLGREVPLSSLPSPGCLPASSQARVKVLRKPGSVGFVLEDEVVFGCFLFSGGATLQEERKNI